ncbi:DUF4190 domain-containing protein [Bacillus sp. CHD6a]|uniref:DUF4190 domain-containing protein n=1 Tax=Bacillus sp. CHD6a TaxID=1643452 RepID=UPI0007615D59|nr:DUF4190 domain-containing protein [Bacillus sp. CHD6a]
MNESVPHSETEKMNSNAVLSLILGIISIISCIISFLSMLFAVPGFVLGVIGLNEIHKTDQLGKGYAKAGLVCSLIGIILPLIIILISLLFFESTDFIMDVI